MPIRPTILITSAADKSGQQVTLQLLKIDYPVLALARRNDRGFRVKDPKKFGNISSPTNRSPESTVTRCRTVDGPNSL